MNNNAGKSSSGGYWFYIETYVHISIKRDSFLLYNPYVGDVLEYSGASFRKALNLIRRLTSRGNSWMVRLSEHDLREPVISGLVRDVRAHFMGDLLDASWSEKKPVQTPPFVIVENSVSKLKSKHIRSVGEGVMEYLTELSLYVNGSCGQNCRMCSSASRQFSCCVAQGDNNKMSLELNGITSLFEQLTASSLSQVNILGGDILAWESLGELSRFLGARPFHKTYYIHYRNIAEKKEALAALNGDNTSLMTPADFPLNNEKLAKALDAAKNVGIEATVLFIVRNEAEFEAAEAAIQKNNISRFDFKPLFDGENLDFFRQNVFFDKESLAQSKPSLRNIYQNGEVNSLNFGRLTIFPNGHIHANPNAPRLGVLGQDSILDVLYKELDKGASWRRIRKHVSPCKGCVFNALCPPLSNYSFAVGRNDLCFKGLQ